MADPPRRGWPIRTKDSHRNLTDSGLFLVFQCQKLTLANCILLKTLVDGVRYSAVGVAARPHFGRQAKCGSRGARLPFSAIPILREQVWAAALSEVIRTASSG